MSTFRIAPYINFQGRAREAMEFYQRALGGTLALRTRDGQGNDAPAGPEDRITHARLDADGASIVGADGHPSYPPTVGDNLAIALTGADRERLSTAFADLAEGGTIKMPLTEQPGRYQVGYILDKFGINWIVTITQA